MPSRCDLRLQNPVFWTFFCFEVWGQVKSTGMTTNREKITQKKKESFFSSSFKLSIVHYVCRSWNFSMQFSFSFHLPEWELVSLIPRRICRAKARDHASEWNEECFWNDAGLPIKIEEKILESQLKNFQFHGEEKLKG